MNRKLMIAALLAGVAGGASPSPAPAPAPAPSPSPSGTVTLNVAVSRTSGPAPLAVMFDATGTTSTAVSDSFRQIVYAANYGDPTAGTFDLGDGSSKNEDSGGPIMWPVFETPGTYQVPVSASDGTSIATTTITITVEDPDVVFAGAATVCVDPAGSTGWGPAGATYATTIPAWTTWTNTRIMLLRGADFSAQGGFSVMDGVQNFQVVAGGPSLGNAIVDSLSIGADRPPASVTIWPDYVTLADITFTNGFRLGGFGSHHLALRCTTGTSLTTNEMGWSAYYMFSDPYQFLPIDQWQIPKFHCMADCSFPGSKTAQEYNMFMTADAHFGVIGCEFGSVIYHNLRIIQGYKFAIRHNRIPGDCNSNIYHCVKINGGDLTEYSEPLTAASQYWASNYGVISDNLVGSATCPYAWLVAVCPENDTSAEGVENMLIENNQMVRSVVGQYDVIWGGKNITEIGNTVTGGTLQVGVGHDGALPAEWKGPYYHDRA